LPLPVSAQNYFGQFFGGFTIIGKEQGTRQNWVLGFGKPLTRHYQHFNISADNFAFHYL
jgi:hypothetical protein